MVDYRKITFCILLLATFIVAQETEEQKGTFKKKLPVRLGSDGRPLLFAPKIEMCVNRKYPTESTVSFLNTNEKICNYLNETYIKAFILI